MKKGTILIHNVLCTTNGSATLFFLIFALYEVSRYDFSSANKILRYNKPAIFSANRISANFLGAKSLIAKSQICVIKSVYFFKFIL